LLGLDPARFEEIKDVCQFFALPEDRAQDVDKSRRRHCQDYRSRYLHQSPKPPARIYACRVGLDLWKSEMWVGMTVTYRRCRPEGGFASVTAANPYPAEAREDFLRALQLVPNHAQTCGNSQHLPS
jgi:hypothetical protein